MDRYAGRATEKVKRGGKMDVIGRSHSRMVQTAYPCVCPASLAHIDISNLPMVLAMKS